MYNRFEMSMVGELKFFLGLQVHQSPRDIFINQSKYALEILKKHGMDKCDSIGTPMATSPKLDAHLSRTHIDQTNYRCMMGLLMYLTSRRPDLVQAVMDIQEKDKNQSQNDKNRARERKEHEAKSKPKKSKSNQVKVNPGK
ncbi:retrovirus-related pol polyprotein from transposon TNT 1-94 [Tanacetum coccineum]